MKHKNSSVNCIVVLLVISVICVSLLAVLNDLLYVPPDMSVFNKAASGTYSEEAVKSAELSTGKIEAAAKGKTDSGKDVIGLYATGNKYGKADGFSVAVVIDVKEKTIVGVYEIVDGSTGGYSYDESKLSALIGKSVNDDVLNNSDLLISGTTNSSIAVRQAVNAAVEYFKQVYGG